jgi:hypothetical protein
MNPQRSRHFWVEKDAVDVTQKENIEACDSNAINSSGSGSPSCMPLMPPHAFASFFKTSCDLPVF